MNLPEIPKCEYPRPDFQRDQWRSLNGTWDFTFQDVSLLARERNRNCLQSDASQIPTDFPKRIVVPFAHQSSLSGLADLRNCESIWYRRILEIPEEWSKMRVLLHFEAVDYEALVWINGQFLKFHRGGHSPFTIDLGLGMDILQGAALSRYKNGECELTLQALDPLDPTIPRGKQGWETPAACWYTQSSGIWQSVWMEAVPDVYLMEQQQHCNLFADLSCAHLQLRLRPNRPAAVGTELFLCAELKDGDKKLLAARTKLCYPQTELNLQLKQPKLWSPEAPHLYDIVYCIEDVDGRIIDRVSSYIGVRSISLSREGLVLNGQPYYQRLVLDQGFWPEGRYTAPSDTALRLDIELAKQAGFNGCRKHMKVEEARFLYWADKLGFLVWSEFPAPYVFNAEAQSKFLAEWLAVVCRDRSHPCVVAWTPYNESWGIGAIAHDIEEQAWLEVLCSLTRQIDPTRPVIDNDGWEHVDSDIYTYHTYQNQAKTLEIYHSNVAIRSRRETTPAIRQKPILGDDGHWHPMMVDGKLLPEMPVLLSEFGGVGFVRGAVAPNAWGYADIPKTEAEFKMRFEEIMRTVYSFRDLCGFCYTQLSDVDQEINGILSFDRQPKIDLEYFKEWFSKSNGE